MSNPLKRAIEESLRRDLGVEETAEDIMNILAEARLLAERPANQISLLTVNGRTLYVLMEWPQASLRELATRLGVTESAAQRAISDLIKSGLIRRSKVQGKNRYKVQAEALLSHPDFRRYHLSAVEFFEQRQID